MNIEEYFKQQIEQGARDQFFYGVETPAEQFVDIRIDIKSHRGSLDTFPDLVYIRHLSEGIPLFRQSQ